MNLTTRFRPSARLITMAAIGANLCVLPRLAADSPTDLTSAAALHGANSSDPARAGIWKAAVPPSGTMHGEFENNDPIGLSAGVKVAADCSINWIDPDSRKLYCFSSATSLAYFLDAPHPYLERARKQWLTLAGQGY